MGLGAAALVGIGLTAWRQVHRDHQPPVPGSLLGVAGLFLVLTLIADASARARPLVTMVAWGLDLAGILHAFGSEGLQGQVSAAESSAASAQGG